MLASVLTHACILSRHLNVLSNHYAECLLIVEVRYFLTYFIMLYLILDTVVCVVSCSFVIFKYCDIP